LEYPDYEEYEEEIPEELQDYQGRKKKEEEEPEIIIKYEQLNEPTVICHKCWVKQRVKACDFLDKQGNEWNENFTVLLPKINKFVKDWMYFDFSGLRETVIPKQDDYDQLVKALAVRIKNLFIGGEEE
jgi:hypothetical protein